MCIILEYGQIKNFKNHGAGCKVTRAVWHVLICFLSARVLYIPGVYRVISQKLTGLVYSTWKLNSQKSAYVHAWRCLNRNINLLELFQMKTIT